MKHPVILCSNMYYIKMYSKVKLCPFLMLQRNIVQILYKFAFVKAISALKLNVYFLLIHKIWNKIIYCFIKFHNKINAQFLNWDSFIHITRIYRFRSDILFYLRVKLSKISREIMKWWNIKWEWFWTHLVRHCHYVPWIPNWCVTGPY